MARGMAIRTIARGYAVTPESAYVGTIDPARTDSGATAVSVKNTMWIIPRRRRRSCTTVVGGVVMKLSEGAGGGGPAEPSDGTHRHEISPHPFTRTADDSIPEDGHGRWCRSTRAREH